MFPKQNPRPGDVPTFLHGGAYLFPLANGQWGTTEGLIGRIGLSVIVPDYPLTPEHTTIGTFDFAQLTIDKVQTEFGHVVIFGDPAGGGLVLSPAVQRRDAGERQVGGLTLYTPRIDVTMTNPAVEDVQHHGKILRASGLEQAGRAWAGGLDPTDWRVNPLYGDSAGLPPIQILQGDANILGFNTIEFARKTVCAGADAHLCVGPGDFRVYVLSAPIIPEAEAVLSRSARFASGILAQS